MTESGVLSSQYNLHFINESTQRKYLVSLKKSSQYDIGLKDAAQKDFRAFDHAVGKLIVLRLPEGVYSLRAWSTIENKKKGKNSLKYQLKKTFRVMNSHSLYLGNLHLLGSENKNTLLIMDNRTRDVKLFYKRYPQVEKNKLLIASKAFLDPASARERMFDAYTGCTLKNYDLFSKKRLPAHIEPFRTLHVNDEERKISRIDGYRLKFKADAGMPLLSIKVELSEIKDFIADKKVIGQWFDEIAKNSKKYDVTFVKKGFFTEYQLKTNSLSHNAMIYMVMMFDNASQMITSMIFVNQAEHLHSYKTTEDFMPQGRAVVDAYQQCVLQGLNQSL